VDNQSSKSHDKCQFKVYDSQIQQVQLLFLSSPPDDARFNYIVDLYNLWYRNFFYFYAKYRCPAPNCISEFFEVRYTRLEYTAKDTYMMA